jgi:L-seryl-tRNA(Ser) seleniumtransferase
MDTLRALPSVHQLLEQPEAAALIQAHGRALVRFAVQQALDEERRTGRPERAQRWERIRGVVESLRRPRLRPVINATGVILHTNLGRAPLASSAAAAAAEIAVRYSTLEFDAAAGRRGQRHDLVADSLRYLTGAEAAAVVNNCAAAVLLMLSALAKGKEVIVGRGELVEIGGGFRMPEIMRLSGTRMVEVGTTNRTRLDDYRSAISAKTAAIMKVHASNFRVVGFTEAVELKPLAELAHANNVPLLHDLGSGSLLDSTTLGVEEEPTLQSSLDAGVDLVAASGDKLLGGPQAGLLLGRRELVERAVRHPLARAVRVDKLTLAALAATLDLYLTQAIDELPVWAMLRRSPQLLKERVSAWQCRLVEHGIEAEVVDSRSAVGGGSLPEAGLDTVALRLTPRHGAPRLLRQLREYEPPVIARIEDGHVLLDPRAVLPDEDDAVIGAIVGAFR